MMAPRADAPKRRPVFLERDSYRRRRRVDAVRILPLIVAALWCIPLLWPVGSDTAISGSRATLYIFTVWALGIAVSAWLSHKLRMTDQDDEDPIGTGSGNDEAAP